MASLPPSLCAGGIIKTAAGPTTLSRRTPTQEEYLTFLRQECQRRGLVEWHEGLTDTGILAAFPFDTYVHSDLQHHTRLTKEQWADPTDSINDIEFHKIDWDEQVLEQAPGYDTAPSQEIDQVKQEDDWNTQRKAFLETYAPLHLQTIIENTKRGYLAAGGTQRCLDEVEKDHATNTVLYLLAELWNLQERLNRDKDPKKERFLSVGVFCDILQESCHVVDCRIAYNETWPDFVSKMNRQLLVRYLVTTHNPAIAETLFVDDDTIWPPEGILPLRNPDDSIVFPEQYTKRADIVYENGPGRGWWALVHPKEDSRGLTKVKTHWKAIDDAEDWDGMMKWLDKHRQATVAFRHESTKERMEFVAKKRVEEETVLGFPGYVPFNVYLDRHWDMVEDKKQIYGPPRAESRVWEELGMEVPKGSEQLPPAAAREVDAKLQEWTARKDGGE